MRAHIENEESWFSVCTLESSFKGSFVPLLDNDDDDATSAARMHFRYTSVPAASF